MQGLLFSPDDRQVPAQSEHRRDRYTAYKGLKEPEEREGRASAGPSLVPRQTTQDRVVRGSRLPHQVAPLNWFIARRLSGATLYSRLFEYLASRKELEMTDDKQPDVVDVKQISAPVSLRSNLTLDKLPGAVSALVQAGVSAQVGFAGPHSQLVSVLQNLTDRYDAVSVAVTLRGKSPGR